MNAMNVDNSVEVDCGKCTHDYACCTTFPVQLTEEESKRFAHNVIPGSKTPVLKRRPSGGCMYFNLDSQKCAIWDTRPKTCREYNCHVDPRVIPLHRPQMTEGETSRKEELSGKIRLVFAVVALDANETVVKTDPFVVTTTERTIIPETLMVVASDEQAVEIMSYTIKPEILKAIGNLKKG